MLSARFVTGSTCTSTWSSTTPTTGADRRRECRQASDHDHCRGGVGARPAEPGDPAPGQCPAALGGRLRHGARRRQITLSIARDALDMQEVDAEGMDKQDRRYLETLIQVFRVDPRERGAVGHDEPGPRHADRRGRAVPAPPPLHRPHPPGPSAHPAPIATSGCPSRHPSPSYHSSTTSAASSNDSRDASAGQASACRLLHRRAGVPPVDFFTVGQASDCRLSGGTPAPREKRSDASPALRPGLRPRARSGRGSRASAARRGGTMTIESSSGRSWRAAHRRARLPPATVSGAGRAIPASATPPAGRGADRDQAPPALDVERRERFALDPERRRPGRVVDGQLAGLVGERASGPPSCAAPRTSPRGPR